MPVDRLKVGKSAKILETARKTNGTDGWVQPCHSQGQQIQCILLKLIKIRRIRSDPNSKIVELLFMNKK
jgi:hypothetical protein